MDWGFDEHRRKLLGFILVGVGVVLLVAQFGGAARFLWPFFIIAPGAGLVAAALATEDATRGLAVPGMVIGTIGTILFFQNLFDHYESWAYAWALIPFAVGAGMAIASGEAPEAPGDEGARHLMTWSLAVFLALAFVFEVFIFGGSGLIGRIVIAGALILGGAAVLFTRSDAGKSDAAPAPPVDVDDRVHRAGEP
ncbi:MAG: hypothetical protein QNJ13_05155 [Paracoccaceae bacterium]|nr:hypothetical protein [Paracoccaceae bacterium]